MSERDVVSCIVMITTYAKRGSAEEALELFDEMRHTEIEPHRFLIASGSPGMR